MPRDAPAFLADGYTTSFNVGATCQPMVRTFLTSSGIKALPASCSAGISGDIVASIPPLARVVSAARVGGNN